MLHFVGVNAEEERFDVPILHLSFAWVTSPVATW
jgi:hypothetical protein